MYGTTKPSFGFVVNRHSVAQYFRFGVVAVIAIRILSVIV